MTPSAFSAIPEAQHLETWLARTRGADSDGDPIPRFVERDLRKYLEGGILAHGFGSCIGRGLVLTYQFNFYVETLTRS